jgi:hypothetical protein
MPTVLNVINEAFGTDDYASLAVKVANGAADNRVSAFLEAWQQWAQGWEPAEAPPQAIRPYALAHWLGDPTSGLAGTWRSIGRGESQSQLLHDQFLRHLLYCDAIALPDPLFGQAAQNPLMLYGELNTVDFQRAAVADTIARLAPFAQLVENDVLIIVPYALEPDLSTDLITDLCEVADTVNAEFPQMPSDWLEITYSRRAAIDLGAQITVGGGDFDPYLPSRAHAHLFRAMCGMVDKAISDASGEVAPQNRLYSRLLDCELPDPIDLPLNDVIAIRKSGEFDVWREAVTDGILRAEQLLGQGDDAPGLNAVTKKEIASSVREAAKTVASRRKSVNPKLSFGLDSVAVGGAVAGAFLTTLPYSAILAGLPALGLLAHAATWWRGRRPGSFARHVAVFGDATK